MKRIFTRLFVFLLISMMLIGSLFAAHKFISMYQNIWDALDNITEAANQINQIDMAQLTRDVDWLRTQFHPLSTQVDHLHRQTFYSPSAKTEYDYNWVSSADPYIAHAGGGIDGATYTNSREAFVRNYEFGHRIFEIDFNLSQDGILIASHDEHIWRSMTGSTLPYTSENFNQIPLLNQYESLSCSEVIELLAAYPDAYIVTDTKATTKSEVMLAFSQLVHCAKQTHPETLERIIPQIYNEEMLPWISNIYPFRSIIFTLYQLRWTPEAILDFCMNSGVRFITMPLDQVTEEVLRLWDTLDIHVGVHTVNDQETASALYDMGIDMLYTDFLAPN